MQLDVDDLPNELHVSDDANDRVWVETVRQGQVLGRQIMLAQSGKIPYEDIEEVAKRYRSRNSSFVTLADNQLPPISVVIPTICRFPQDLKCLVEGLASMDYPKFEVIVVDNRVFPTNELPDFGACKNVRVIAERIPGALRLSETEVSRSEL